MTETIASLLVHAAGLYLAVGLAFAIPFVILGIGRIDPAASESGWGFRLVVLPGCMAMWPLLLWRWVAGAGKPPAEHNSHRDAAVSKGVDR